MRRCLSWLIVLAASWHAAAVAQKLPPPSRTVYKCAVGGKVVYGDVPCEGAQRIDVQPTRGLNKSSGVERVGADVRAEQFNEQMAQALRPLFGESAEQRAVRHRRARLPPELARRCDALDVAIARSEADERGVRGAQLKAVQSKLFGLRQEFHRSGC